MNVVPKITRFNDYKEISVWFDRPYGNPSDLEGQGEDDYWSFHQKIRQEILRFLTDRLDPEAFFSMNDSARSHKVGIVFKDSLLEAGVVVGSIYAALVIEGVDYLITINGMRSPFGYYYVAINKDGVYCYGDSNGCIDWLI